MIALALMLMLSPEAQEDYRLGYLDGKTYIETHGQACEQVRQGNELLRENEYLKGLLLELRGSDAQRTDRVPPENDRKTREVD